MLLPQFTIRWLLWAMVLCAVVSAIGAAAAHGNHLAFAACVALLAVVVSVACQAGVFCTLRILAGLFRRKQRSAEKPGSNPFAGGVLLAIVLAGASAQAGGFTRTVNGHGLTVRVEVDNLVGFGYHAARVTITPVKPLVADRRLSLRFQGPGDYASPESIVRRTVELPAGTSGPMEFSLPLPPSGNWAWCQFAVLEDQTQLKGMIFQVNSPSTIDTDWVLAFPSFLVMPGKTTVDTQRLAWTFPAIEDFLAQQRSDQQKPKDAEWPADLWNERPAERFPQRWIEYTSFDVVYLQREQFLALAQHQPQALRAMLEWVAAGGNLWIAGAGEKWEHLHACERPLGWPESEIPQDRKAAPGRWHMPSGAIPDDQLSVTYTVPSWMRNNSSATQPPQPPPDPKLPRPRMLLRTLGLGQVAVFAPESLFPGAIANWRYVLNEIGDNRWLWHRRHGHVPGAWPDDFWDLMVPGTETAPVVPFWLLITLFVVLIGPVNYFWLQRRRRLNLLVVTIPLGAALVTAGFMAYALLAEGFHTWVRVRSVSWIDQRRGEAACWSWLSYYAGTPAANGLHMPDDVAVLPLTAPDALHSRRVSDEERELSWDDQQWLRSGWLAPRTPAQYLTLRARPTPRGLKLIEPASPGQGPLVRNELGVRLDLLAVCLAEGSCFQTEGLAPGALARLVPAAPGGVLERIQRQAAPGAVPHPRAESLRSRRYYRMSPDMFGGAGMQSSRLEKTLADCRPAPGQYVALAAEDPEVASGIEYAREVASVHLIRGEW